MQLRALTLLALAGAPLLAQEGAPAETTGAETTAPETTPAEATAPEEAPKPDFAQAASGVQDRLEASLQELGELREELAAEMVPLSRRLSELEAEYSSVGLELQKTNRLLDSRTLDLSNLKTQIKSRRDEASYLTGLLGDYQRKFESGLHIAELARPELGGALEEARLALENSNLSEQEVFSAQAKVLDLSLDRLFEALGGSRFDGTAVNAEGLVESGTFLMVGPAALFRSDDGQSVGTASQKLGSLEPALTTFGKPEDTAAAASLVETGSGTFPLDPSLGDAHLVEATENEPFLEHVKKGGEVMIPIGVMAGLALLVALYKWIALSLQRKPSKKQVAELLGAVAERDEELAQRKVRAIRGPVGRMLAEGVSHIREPRELIEEVMYEKLLTTRLKLERMLPFIAICAASAPLLGLLGTVTGIISTFKLITVFGSGDVKSLSGGISEALITTKFGLIVAIPSLLLHAFLSRKARGIVAAMESNAMAFVNQVSRTPFAAGQDLRPEGVLEPVERPAQAHTSPGETPPHAARTEVKDALNELLTTMIQERIDEKGSRKPTGEKAAPAHAGHAPGGEEA